MDDLSKSSISPSTKLQNIFLDKIKATYAKDERTFNPLFLSYPP